MFYNDTVKVHRPGTRDNRAGDTVPALDELLAALAAGTAEGTPRAEVHVRTTNASTDVVADDRDLTLAWWRVASRPGSGDWDLLPGDLLELPDGAIASVVGIPARPSDPIGGGLHHVEVLVRQVAALGGNG